MSAEHLFKPSDRSQAATDDYIIASADVLLAAAKNKKLIDDFASSVDGDLAGFYAGLPSHLPSGPFRAAAAKTIGLHLKKLQLIGNDYNAACRGGGFAGLTGKTAPLITTPQMAMTRKDALTHENLLVLKEIAGQFNDRARDIVCAQMRQLDEFHKRTAALGFGFYDYLKSKRVP